MKNVPKLRFKGFSDEWEEKKLGDLIEERNDKTADRDKYPLYSLTIEDGVVPKTERYERDFLVKKDENFKIVYKNDFVYNPMNLRFGALALYKGDIPVSVSGYYNVFYFYNNMVSEFWNNYLKTERMFYVYNTIATGSLVEKKRVHYSQFKELNLKIPSLQEQQKIANFLTKVDKIIEKQDEKVENLEKYKKGMMQKIFSQEVRFKKDDGGEYLEWEEMILNDLCLIQKGEQCNKSELLVDGLYYVLNGGITPSGFMDKYNTEMNTISISEGGNSCGFVKFNFDRFWSGGHCYTLLNLKKNVFTKYLYHYLKYKESYIMALRVGSGLPNIQKKALALFGVYLPCLEEQQKIADFLSNIDTIIEKEKQKLEALREWKEGLLQKMFV